MWHSGYKNSSTKEAYLYTRMTRDNGEIIEKMISKQGLVNGLMREFLPSGEVVTYFLKTGAECGETIRYNPDGTIKSREDQGDPKFLEALKFD